MSASDEFFNGQVFANRQRNAQVSRERGTTDAWIAHAKKVENERNSWRTLAQKLQAQLEDAEIETVRGDAHGQASLEMVRELRQRLATVAPTDPMGKAEVMTPRLRQRKRELVEARGFKVVSEDGFKIARK